MRSAGRFVSCNRSIRQRVNMQASGQRWVRGAAMLARILALCLGFPWSASGAREQSRPAALQRLLILQRSKAAGLPGLRQHTITHLTPTPPMQCLSNAVASAAGIS